MTKTNRPLSGNSTHKLINTSAFEALQSGALEMVIC